MKLELKQAKEANSVSNIKTNSHKELTRKVNKYDDTSRKGDCIHTEDKSENISEHEQPENTIVNIGNDTVRTNGKVIVIDNTKAPVEK